MGLLQTSIFVSRWEKEGEQSEITTIVDPTTRPPPTPKSGFTGHLQGMCEQGRG